MIVLSIVLMAGAIAILAVMLDALRDLAAEEREIKEYENTRNNIFAN